MTSEFASFLQMFTSDLSTQTSLNGSIAGSSSNTLPSTVRLDPPTNLSSPEINDSQTTRLLNGSRPQYSAIGVPIGVPLPANGQTIEPEESEQMAPERLANACCTFLNKYKRAVMHFRSTCYIHILHLLIVYIPLASVLVGWIYSQECPQNSYLTFFVRAAGIAGVSFMGFFTALIYREYHGTPCSRLQKNVVGALFVFVLVLLIVEMYLVGMVSPNFNVTSEDYCNKTFYYYMIGKEVASAIALITSALIYFPGSSLHNCCLDIPAPSPATAFFSSL